MNTKDLARYDRSDREGIEHVDKRLPSLDIGPSFTFVVEPVDYDRWGEARNRASG